MVISVHFYFLGNEINEPRKLKITISLASGPGHPFKGSEFQDLLHGVRTGEGGALSGNSDKTAAGIGVLVSCPWLQVTGGDLACPPE